MIYLVGGAPRSGKSTLSLNVSRRLGIGWISTDLLLGLLRVKKEVGVKTEWNAAPEAIAAAATWFFPYLEHFVWGISSLADSYLVEGVDFLPEQVAQLQGKYSIRAVFLGCAQMTLEWFDRYPGRSPGYAGLPEETRRKFAQDIPPWSEYVRQEAERYGHSYVDTSHDFSSRLNDAESVLIVGE